MMKTYLCKCTKCDVVLLDQNPQKGAVRQPIPEGARDMELINDGSGGYIWTCPECGMDDFLIDLPHPLTNK